MSTPLPRLPFRDRIEAAAKWLLLRAHWLLLLVALSVGLLTVGDFGESWDEKIYIEYGEYGLRAYQSLLSGHLPPPHNAFLEQYGAAYVTLGAALASLASSLGAAWPPIVTWHVLYFITFLACLEVMYAFARRWLSVAAAFGVMLLFASQPLFWGHAFINLKDVPFLTFFLASVHLGFCAVDRARLSPRQQGWVLAAAATLGVTISIRTAGPLAGMLVSIYAVLKLRTRSLLFLFIYVLAASVVMIGTWPYLWPAPIPRFLSSLQTMASFPFFMKTQFMGAFLSASEVPWFYVPVIFGIQLTEPAVALILVGLALSIWWTLRRSKDSPGAASALALCIGWTLLPIAAMIAAGASLYDNARQLFFLLPPLFILAGVTLQALEQLLRSRVLYVTLLGLLILPGVWSGVRLHPYEYVYYNSFVGGTRGAYGDYEMDYWATSFAAVRGWLNANAPQNTRIWTPGGPTYLLSNGLRPDIELACIAETDCGVDYDYYVALARLKAERRCRGAETILTVGRGGAVFAVVKQLPEGRLCR